MDFVEKLSLQLADDYKQCSNSEDVSSTIKKYLDKLEESNVAVYPSLPVGRKLQN